MHTPSHALTVLVELVVLLGVVGVVARLVAGVRGDRRRLVIGVGVLPCLVSGCTVTVDGRLMAVVLFWLLLALAAVATARWLLPSHDPVQTAASADDVKPLDRLWDAQVASGSVSAHELMGRPIVARDAAMTAQIVPQAPEHPDVAEELARATATTAALQQRLYELTDTAVQLATQLHTHFDKNGFGHSQRAVWTTLKRLEAIRAEVRPTPLTPEAS